MKTKYEIVNDGKTLVATRTFDIPVRKLWEAWTTQNILEEWWAPKPYLARTKSFDFSEGGHWHYAMEGPEGDVHWGLTTYEVIVPNEKFIATDAFCDEEKVMKTDLPGARWIVEFDEQDEQVVMKISTIYQSSEDLEKVAAMGMKEGFDMALNQLEELASA